MKTAIRKKKDHTSRRVEHEQTEPSWKKKEKEKRKKKNEIMVKWIVKLNE